MFLNPHIGLQLHNKSKTAVCSTNENCLYHCWDEVQRLEFKDLNVIKFLNTNKYLIAWFMFQYHHNKLIDSVQIFRLITIFMNIVPVLLATICKWYSSDWTKSPPLMESIVYRPVCILKHNRTSFIAVDWWSLDPDNKLIWSIYSHHCSNL